MAKLMKIKEIKEGEILCKWFENRLIRNNKNVLGVQLGGTGSGKSYRDLRIAELWYQYHFKKKFPIENICFGVSEILKRLSTGELKRGELLIFEEAGVNLGSLDFQNKVSKMFNYVLQSFRSMNIGILFNLPYLSMLNKQARMLLHYSMESAGIDFDNKINKCKPFFHQVNQATGVIYKKYLRIRINGKIRTIKRFRFSLPSDYLIEAYENKKNKFLQDITKEYTFKVNEEEKKLQMKLARRDLTPTQKEVYEMLCQGMKHREIAEKIGFTRKYVTAIKKAILKKGYAINPKEAI